MGLLKFLRTYSQVWNRKQGANEQEGSEKQVKVNKLVVGEVLNVNTPYFVYQEAHISANYSFFL